MLIPRILTAIVLIALIVPALLYLSPHQLVFAIAGVMLVAAWEWGGFFPNSNLQIRLGFVALVAAAFACVFFVTGFDVTLPALLWLAMAWWTAAFVWLMLRPDLVPRWSIVLATIAVCVPAWAALSALQLHTNQGPQWLLFLILLVASADIGAYFAGRMFGKTKLAPQVSPGKTWEGVAGGTLLSGAVAFAGSKWFGYEPLQFTVLGVVAVWVSVIGDLTESLFKRHVGLKDSGRILPGHGGVMDRIDSLTAGAPVFVLGLYFLGGLSFSST
ncbi:MAG: phosphatidate cytidylyltransferase [Pseudomonadota bacterium]